MKLLPCLSHCCRSPIVGFYQQWALVILHNLDSNRVVPFLFRDALNDQVRIGWFSRWSLVKVLNIGSVGQEEQYVEVSCFIIILSSMSADILSARAWFCSSRWPSVWSCCASREQDGVARCRESPGPIVWQGRWRRTRNAYETLHRHSQCQFGLKSSILLILHGEQPFLKWSHFIQLI